MQLFKDKTRTQNHHNLIGNYISVKVKKETEEKDGEENKDNEREKRNFYLILEIKICRESLPLT